MEIKTTFLTSSLSKLLNAFLRDNYSSSTTTVWIKDFTLVVREMDTIIGTWL